MEFDDKDLIEALEAADTSALDALEFGVIAMDKDGRIEAYNRFEGELSGLTPSRLIGKHFFTGVAPCTNNFMVAQRFVDEMPLDAVIDYVFTVRMRPTRVKLRLLRSATSQRQYLLVRRA